jgi:hypothetical protein
MEILVAPAVLSGPMLKINKYYEMILHEILLK